jgi:hypothetical protein
MRSFLEDQWGFEVDYAPDKDLQKVEDKYNALTTLAASAAEYKSVLFVVIYYSGHGTIRGKETYGHTVDQEAMPIESWVRKLARRANVFVLGMFDCCRTE